MIMMESRETKILGRNISKYIPAFSTLSCRERQQTQQAVDVAHAWEVWESLLLTSFWIDNLNINLNVPVMA